MNAILSVILCLALLLGGGGGMGVEPETTTTWTLRNVTLTLGDGSVTLAPEARLSAAAGGEKAMLHFEVGADGQTYLPLTLDASPEELRLALSGRGRTYTLSDAALLELLGFSGSAQQEITLAGDLIHSYFDLLNMLLNDPEATRACSEAAGKALLESGVESVQDVEIEFNGARYPGMSLRLCPGVELLDALRGCGVPEMENLLQKLLALAGRSLGAEADSFAGFFADVYGAPLPTPELTLTVAEQEDFTYISYSDFSMPGLEELGAAVDLNAAVLLVPEGESRSSVDVQMRAQGLKLGLTLAEQVEGDLEAPDSVNVDADITFGPEAAEGALKLSLHGESERDEVGLNESHVQLSVDGEEWMNAAQVAPDETFASELADLECGLDCVQSAGEGGAVTTSVALYADAEDLHVGLDFELDRAEAPYKDAFAGTEEYALSLDALQGDATSPLALAMMADVSQLSLDAMKLAQEPSVQELVQLVQNFAVERVVANYEADEYEADEYEADEYVADEYEADEYEADENIVDEYVADEYEADENVVDEYEADEYEANEYVADEYEADEPEADETVADVHEDDISFDDSDYNSGTATVDTLEMAAAIYTDELPDYTPPEGYAFAGAEVAPEYLSLRYESSAGGTDFSLTAYPNQDAPRERYVATSGALTPQQDPVVEIYPDGNGMANNATIEMPDGSMLSFYFDNAVGLEELGTILAGLK